VFAYNKPCLSLGGYTVRVRFHFLFKRLQALIILTILSLRLLALLTLILKSLSCWHPRPGTHFTLFA